mmetsp:Transcript_23774/g.57337  ORF Transcript_23774/g.57337 Transcript_23774/m.57337 type:complete len:405 (-) Transcript_23774:617-1831(-)
MKINVVYSIVSLTMAAQFQVACALEPGPSQNGSAKADAEAQAAAMLPKKAFPDKGTFYTQANVDEDQKAAVQKAADDHKFSTQAAEKARALLEEGIVLSDVRMDALDAFKYATDTQRKAVEDQDNAQDDLEWIYLEGGKGYGFKNFFEDRSMAADAASKALQMAKLADEAMADADTAKAVYDDKTEVDTRAFATTKGSSNAYNMALSLDNLSKQLLTKSEEVKKAENQTKAQLFVLAADKTKGAEHLLLAAEQAQEKAKANPDDANLQASAQHIKKIYNEAQEKADAAKTNHANQEKVYGEAVLKGQEVSALSASIAQKLKENDEISSRAYEFYNDVQDDFKHYSNAYQSKKTVSEEHAFSYILAAQDAEDALARVQKEEYKDVDLHYQYLERYKVATKKKITG